MVGDGQPLVSHGQASSAIVRHGRSWAAMASDAQTWSSMLSYGQPLSSHAQAWSAMASHEQPWVTTVTQGRQKGDSGRHSGDTGMTKGATIKHKINTCYFDAPWVFSVMRSFFWRMRSVLFLAFCFLSCSALPNSSCFRFSFVS